MSDSVMLQRSAPLSSTAPTGPLAPSKPNRLVSLDAYRGATMLLLASGGFGIYSVSKHFPHSHIWSMLAYQFNHTQWRGYAIWDMIQPSFMFMAGVSLPFSVASRQAKGQSFLRMLLHALWRSLALILLGLFLRSMGRPQTYFTFEDVIEQIGLGYPFLFLLAFTKPRTQFIAAGAILLGYWAAFALYPLPPANFDYHSVGVPANWSYHLTGFAAHWNKNTNFAAAFDRWFLNLFPRASHFDYNAGGYQTLSFIPSLATMIFGMLSGELLKSRDSASRKFLILIAAAVVGVSLSSILDVTGICPCAKRIWTPAWVLYSTGLTCAILAMFFAVVDCLGLRRLAFPLVVVGMNSIAMYCMTEVGAFQEFLHDNFRTHLGKNAFDLFGKPYSPIVDSLAITLVLWLICLWMYRRKIFLRI